MTDAAASDALTAALMQPAGPFPAEAVADARELSIATVHNCDMILSFKYTICNTIHQRAYAQISRDHGYQAPEIGTPYQLDYAIAPPSLILEELYRIREQLYKSGRY